MIGLLFLVFFVLLLMGFPIAYALAISCISYLLMADVSLVVVPLKMYGGMDAFVLLSIPGFILAGNIMSASGMTDRIVDFSNKIVGHIRGGLSLANIGASMIFAGISGTAVADSASLGSILIPAMKKEGYDADFACAVTSSSSTIGPIIPPSMPMIIVGSLTGLSIGKLFLAGALPGLLLAIGYMLVSYMISLKKQHPISSRASLRAMGKSFVGAFWSLVMTLLILFGIIGGVFTPTEASVVAVLYAVLIGSLVYRSLRWRQLLDVLKNTVSTTSSLMLLVGFANLFGWILIIEEVPQALAGGLMEVTSNKWLLLILINLVLLIVGTFMETLAALLILFPILLQVATSVGVDPIQFAVLAVLNLIIGLNTPPVGVCLFVVSSIGKVPVDRVARAGLPFLLVSLVVLLMVTFVPFISLWLPGLFMD
ncbi:MAG: TRAP transporter large permease [Bacteroidota bacterium]